MRRLIHLMLSPSCRLARLMVAEKRVACDPVHGRGCPSNPCRCSWTWTAPGPKACGRSWIIWKAIIPIIPWRPADDAGAAPVPCAGWIGRWVRSMNRSPSASSMKKPRRVSPARGFSRAPDMNVIRAGREELKAGAGRDRPGGGNQRQSGLPRDHAGRSGGGGASVGAGLFRRSAVERFSRRRGMVCADEVAARLPLHPVGPRAGPAAGRPLCRTRFLTARSGSRARTRRRLRCRALRRRADARAGQCRAAERISGRRPSWRDGLDGRARRPGAPIPQALWPEARSVIVLGLNYGPEDDPLAMLARARHGRDLGLCPGRRLSRSGEEEAQGGGRAYLPDLQGRSESLCRHRAGDGKAAGAEGRHGLAGQAHQSGVARFRLLAVSGQHLHHPGLAAGRRRKRIIAAIAMPAWISAPPTPFPRPTGWMRGAAFPISPSRTRARSRANSAAAWATASMAATIAWRSVPGTNSPAPRSEMKLQARDELNAPRLAELAALDDAAFRALFRKSPVKRIGRDRFLRNVMIAIGNSGDAALVQPARAALDDASPLVRGAAVWALSRLLPAADFAELAQQPSRRTRSRSPDRMDSGTERVQIFPGLAPRSRRWPISAPPGNPAARRPDRPGPGAAARAPPAHRHRRASASAPPPDRRAHLHSA